MIVRSAEVERAVAAGEPVVALESTIVAHGLPWPENLAIAHDLEAAVRRGGAVPATIAVVGGVCRVGLDEGTLETLARDGARFRKAGATDLAVHVARRGDAATTVSATAALAARAGVRVFATGGIGGVHRGDAWDVSHDLAAMAREPVAVVSAGAKAILDLPRTFEVLETLGVLVVGHGTDELPAFYSRRSGLRLEHRVDDLDELAAICDARWRGLGQGGVLVATPIPADAEIAADAIVPVIEEALAAADAGGVTGKAMTPFLLGRIAAITRGGSVVANRALAIHDAEVGAGLAVALARRARSA